ncbi:hypothetical protein [Streptomyces spongiae]|uniref:Uncharacterized protein n=1 Tax=Streptomyces spongiae TaxID=565072 RepID=A0A5N8XCV4_9ACTN|nr:hypothetical protein [Streptomyces spongiae]MPY56946.1 hypothetical protein [Streptomyces spongiae]
MHPTHIETQLALHHAHLADLRHEAEAYRLARLAAAARQPRGLRTRLGWTLVEVGLRLASAPRTVAAAH